MSPGLKLTVSYTTTSSVADVVVINKVDLLTDSPGACSAAGATAGGAGDGAAALAAVFMVLLLVMVMLSILGPDGFATVRDNPARIRAVNDEVEAMGELSLLLPTGDAATGEVYATLLLGQSQEPVLRLGNNFMLDSEVAERVALIEGVHRVQLGARRGAAKLRLVA